MGTEPPMLLDERTQEFRTVSPLPFVIGRLPASHLRLDDPDRRVSGAHAQIVAVGSGYQICDTSTNGTRIERLGSGRIVQAMELHGTCAPLENGARIVLPSRLPGLSSGGWSFRFWTATRTLESSVRFEPRNGECHVRGQKVELTRAEVALMHVLWRHPRQAVPYEDLFLALGYVTSRGRDRAEKNAVQFHIGRLRAKIELNPRHPVHLVTVGVTGFRLEPEY